MRPLTGTANSTASSNATMLYTSDTNTRVFTVSFKARSGNSGKIYVGGDSTVLAATGYELSAGNEWTLAFSDVQSNNLPSTVKAHVWHMSGASTSDKLDWNMLLET